METRLIEEFYSDNKIKQRACMKNFKLDGICEFYDTEGYLEQRSNFKDGVLDGSLETYTKGELRSKRSFKEGYLERLESLEQLRALENGIDINLAEINDAPISIDTPKDLKTFIEQKDKIK